MAFLLLYELYCIRPKVSVIVIAHNRREYILQALMSISKQTLPREMYEVIVVKNFRDIETDNYIVSNKYSNFYTEAEDAGHKMAIGISNAKGDIISFLEDDDLFEPTKLETIISYFLVDKDLCFLHNSMFSINENGSPITYHKLIPKLIEFAPSYAFLETCRKEGIKPTDIVYSSCIAIKKGLGTAYLDLLKKVKAAPDTFLVLCMINSNCKGIHIPEKLTKYRLHFSQSIQFGDYNKFQSGNLEIRKKWMEDYAVMSENFVNSNAKTLARFLMDYNNLLTTNLKPFRSPREKINLLFKLYRKIHIFHFYNYLMLTLLTLGTIMSPLGVINFYRFFRAHKYQRK